MLRYVEQISFYERHQHIPHCLIFVQLHFFMFHRPHSLSADEVMVVRRISSDAARSRPSLSPPPEGSAEKARVSNFSWDIGEIFVGDAQALGLLWLTQVRYLQFRFRKWTMWELMGSAGKTKNPQQERFRCRLRAEAPWRNWWSQGMPGSVIWRSTLVFFFDKIAGAPFGGLPTAALKARADNQDEDEDDVSQSHSEDS